ncbi:hypothetical protein AB6A40_001275 [Gnathostoma spinigerum]|uniref:Nuclear export mediator factor NEMF n=1 Tax=Gnathostoma spinigerum TaxID=75299 RepID=A0ABD6E609_9BILA
MKNRFSTIDVFAALHDLKELCGLRVVNVYDIDSRTYLIRMQKPDEKVFIMFESGNRIHKTNFEWPKAQMPSSFSMKLRKHIKQKRLESVNQLGIDRIIDMQFGIEDRACHVIVELYDRGNVVLTDEDYTILNILRPRTDQDNDVRFTVKEKYPVANARQSLDELTENEVYNLVSNAKKGGSLRRILAPGTQYGPALIEHCLLAQGFPRNAQIGINVQANECDISRVLSALSLAKDMFNSLRTTPSRGYLFYKVEKTPDGKEVESYQEFHPVRFLQFETALWKEFDSFCNCVDDFFSKIEEQKIDQKALNAEREALKKLENVKNDQQQRIIALEQAQAEKREMAELIELNTELVDRALLVIRTAIANQLSWEMIEEMRIKAAENGDPIASVISSLNLNSNEMFLSLRDPFNNESIAKKVRIDIGLSAYQNSRQYHTEKKAAVGKQQKTIKSSTKALRSAQLKTKETVEQVRNKRNVVKSRKQMWFEKFFWFVSSENYLVIGGRDAQQNELIVKRYLRANDLYVHADVRGASSVVIRNKAGGGEIPPKTLNEAATMAVCYSSAWEAKIVASAWWVYQKQVSRTAPTGEYLTPGSFMIRGKKNYLPASQLQMGFGIMFKLDDDSVERHRNERRILHRNEETDEDININNDSDEGEELAMIEDEEEEVSDKEDAVASGKGSPTGEDVFPDIQVPISGIIRNEDNEEEEYTILQVGNPRGQGLSRTVKEREKNLQEEKRKQAELDKKVKKPGTMTKRQKHKLDKIKRKYGDQDDEERELRMMLLGSRGVQQKTDLDEDKNAQSFANAKKLADLCLHEEAERVTVRQQSSDATERQKDNLKEDEVEEELDEADIALMTEEEIKMLDSLTWRPLAEDTLLYPLVVVAPYQTMHNFKYKVKLTPGTSKRGKAAKSAIALFQRDKTCYPQELSHLKVLAFDDSISRNIPGKVRISAPQLNRK